jgi:hypothetical protein
MKKIDLYRDTLRTLTDWTPFLLAESGLPGPRGNLELLAAVVGEGDRKCFLSFLENDRPEGTIGVSEEFLVICGIAGLGKLVADGDRAALELLRRYASSGQWRYREAVAMALQYYGRARMDDLLRDMAEWIQGNMLEQRAVCAGICEPALITDPRYAKDVLTLLSTATKSIETAPDHRGEEFRVLAKALEYCWSVAIAAYPGEGMKAFNTWCRSDNPHIRKILRKNLEKKRLIKLDPAWLTEMSARLR